MSQPLTDAIVALTTYANTVTGASDTTLSDAVASLVDGYGGGGGGNFEMGTFTPSEETNKVTVSVSKLYTHFAIWASDTLANTTAASSGRTLLFAHGDNTTYTCVDVNTSKGGIYITDRTGYNTWSSYINFSASQIQAMFLGNGATTRMAAGQSYTWLAW